MPAFRLIAIDLTSLLGYLKQRVFVAENSRTYYLALLTLCALATSTSTHATGLDDLEQLMSEMEESGDLHLLSIAEEETTIATRSKLNADYVPGIISILRTEILQAKGATTVIEALSLVPGIEQSHDRIGNQVALVRGVGASFASGNMKILVDNISINAAVSALADPVLNMPLSQVERIEVIRGPGSSLYGEFAYAGVVNVITRKDSTHAYVGTGSFGQKLLGGNFSQRDSESGLSFNLNLAGSQQDDSQTSSGEDGLYNGSHALLGQATVSNAPGPINDEEQYRAALFNLSYHKFTLQVQAIDGGHGDYFGSFDVLPEKEAGIAYRNKHRNLTLAQAFDYGQHLSGQLRLGWQRYDNHFDILILPPGYLVGLGPTLPEYPNGWNANGFVREEQLQGSLDLRWNGWSQHQLLTSISATNIDIIDAWQAGNVDPITTLPLPSIQHFTGEKNWLNENKQRDIRSIALQDEYSANPKTTYTLGVRYDDYSDVGENISPRLAGVYRHTDEHIFKAQFAEAFRPPTFHEEWNSSAQRIDPETIRTTELGYIHRLWNRVDRITLFHSRMRDLIIFEGLLDYKNLLDAKVSGIELETEQYLFEWMKLHADLSYSDAENASTGNTIAGAAQWLSHIGIMTSHSSSTTVSIDMHYVGQRKREAIDTRDKLGSYYTINTSLTYNAPRSPFTLRIGIKNLLDREVYYPAALTWDNLGSTYMESYSNDYPQPGRTGWFLLDYKL